MNSTALRIAFRDLKASWSRFLFVVLAVAAGVGALTGVRGFSEAFRSMLNREARTLMAADIFVRVYAPPTPAQEEVVNSLARKGATVTRVMETLSMVSSPLASEPALVTIKALDPDVYPLYGEVRLEPATRLKDALKADTVLISDDLKARLKVNPGDEVRVGTANFRVAAVIANEPDRMSGSFSVGPRLMIARGGLERAGLLALGSRASQRILFKLPAGLLFPAEADLKKTFPEALIVNYREMNPNVSMALQRSTTFLSLVSLIALIVGAIGVATAMHAHLQTRMDSIAVMKSIGGRSGQITRIYLAQTVLLGLAGGVLGVAFGMAVQAVFPVLLQKFLQVQPEVVFTPAAALQGIGLGLLTTILFTVPPLQSISEIRPSLILRRDMPEVRPSLAARLRRGGRSLLTTLILGLGLAVVAGSLVTGTREDVIRISGYFIGGLLLSLLVLGATAALLLKGLQSFAARAKGLPMTVRHAIANLHRPGSQARTVLTALGVGVMFTLTVYLVQRSVLDEIRRAAPPGMPNVFLVDITAAEKDEVVNTLRKSGAASRVEVIATVSSRIAAVNGTPIDQLPMIPAMRRFRMARNVSMEAAQPDGLTIVQGSWWSKPDKPRISIEQYAARVLKLHPGSTLTLTAFGRTIETEVAAIHRSDNRRLRGMIEFYASPGTLEGLPAVYYGSARVRTDAVGSLQKALYDKFPTVTVINVADILDRVQEVVDQIALVVRFISGFAIFAGAIILASSVAGTRFRRVREMAVFKTLGATRRRIAAMFSAEFLILGTTAGLMGSLLATGFTWLVLKKFFQEAPFRFDGAAIAFSIAATALVAAAAGWLAIFRILGQKPLEVLRGE